jgi:hypothetical protein
VSKMVSRLVIVIGGLVPCNPAPHVLSNLYLFDLNNARL